MSNLYDVVKDVINCKTIDEANNRLFGVDGITINSQEYYEKIYETEFELGDDYWKWKTSPQ